MSEGGRLRCKKSGREVLLEEGCLDPLGFCDNRDRCAVWHLGRKRRSEMVKKVLELNDDNFDQEVLQSDIPVFVDFWAPWCGPCQMIAPIVESLAEEYEGRCKVGKLNVDENPRTAMRFGIMSIPTLMLFKDGKVIERIVGAVSKEIMAGIIRRVI